MKEPKDWITVNGVHVPIFDGESKEDAVNKFIHKTKNKEEQIKSLKEQASKLSLFGEAGKKKRDLLLQAEMIENDFTGTLDEYKAKKESDKQKTLEKIKRQKEQENQSKSTTKKSVYKDMTNEQIVEKMNELGLKFTQNPKEAIYALSDGRLISDDFKKGIRGEEHRVLESIVDGNRYDKNFWDKALSSTKMLMLVPETKVAIMSDNQQLSLQQNAILKKLGYLLQKG